MLVRVTLAQALVYISEAAHPWLSTPDGYAAALGLLPTSGRGGGGFRRATPTGSVENGWRQAHCDTSTV